ncbi:putative Ig domain-containing protein [Hydrogenimonas sp.]
MKFLNASVFKVFLMFGVALPLFATVNSFDIVNVGFLQNRLYLGKNAEPHFETTTINTDESLTFITEVYRVDDDAKVHYHELTYDAETLNGRTLSSTGLWLPESLDAFYIRVKVFNANGDLLKSVVSGIQSVESGSMISKHIKAALLASFKTSGYDVATFEDVYNIVKYDYDNGYKYLFYHSADFSYAFMGGGYKVIFDIADYLGISSEGKEGWVSTWIDPYFKVDLSLPVSFEIGVFKIRMQPGLEDYRTDFVPVDIGVDLSVGKWGGSLSTYDLINDFRLTSDAIGVNIGVGFKSYLTFAKEFDRVGLEQMFNFLLSETPTESLKHDAPYNLIYIGEYASRIFDVGPTVNRLAEYGHIRPFSLDDGGSNTDGVTTNYPTDLALVADSLLLGKTESKTVRVDAIYKENDNTITLDVTDKVEFRSYPEDALTLSGNTLSWNNTAYDQAEIALAYNGRFKSYTIYKKTERPVASFTLSASSATLGATVDATSTSFDPDGDLLTYSWRLFGPDGTSTALPASSSVSFVVSQVGTYTLELTVQDEQNNTVSYSGTIAVTDSYPNIEVDYEDDGAHIYISNLSIDRCSLKQIGSYTVPSNEIWKSIGFAASQGDVILLLRRGSAPELKNGDTCSLGYAQAFYADAEFDWYPGTNIFYYERDLFPGETVYLAAFSYDGVTDYSINSKVTASYDRDGDGVPDSADAFPDDPAEQYDSDRDGIGDNADRFDNDAAAAFDTDGDGYPDGWNAGKSEADSTTGLRLDRFITDPAAAIDTDGDGHPDMWNNGRTQADSTTGLTLDMFVDDPAEWIDSDGDGVGDNADLFDDDPTEWADSDGDGVGDNGDAAPNDPTRTANTAPTLEAIPLLRVPIGQTASYELNVSDAENDAVTLTILSLDSNVSDYISIAGKRLTVDATNGSQTRFGFFVEAVDALGAKTVKPVEVEIYQDLYPPVITGIAPLEVPEGNPFEFTPTINASSGDDVSWSFDSPQPSGMAINATTGRIVWSYPVSDGSPYTISIKAENSLGADVETFQLTVLPKVADINVSVDFLTFSRQLYATASAAQSVIIGNGGDLELVSDVTVVGTDADSFVLDGSCRTVLPAQSCSLSVGFVPAKVGLNSAALRISSNDPDTPVIEIPLSGTGIVEAPVVGGVEDAIIEESVPYRATPSINPSAGPEVVWSFLSSVPEGMSIDAATGEVVWSNPVADGSPYIIEINATNSAGSGTKSWRLAVAPLDPDESVDTDGDGMSDRFERENGLNPLVDDADLDSDNDGTSNIQEYLNGTDPGDPSSYVAYIDLQAGWNMVALPMQAVVNIAELNNSDIEVVRSYQDGEWYVWTKEGVVSTEKPLSELAPGHGYWIKALNPTSIPVAGVEVSTETEIFADGEWHMAGSAKIEDLSAFFEKYPEITTVWKFENGVWKSVSGKSDVQQSLDNANIERIYAIEPGEGFMYK